MYFCTQCGEKASPLPAHPSIDERYAIAGCGNCGHMDHKTYKLVPATVQAVANEARARELAKVFQENRLIRLHKEHIATGHLTKGCADCAELAEAS